jgi:solute carrier family 35 protein C2
MVLPIGVLTALDVMLSNLGIMYAPLSLYTAIKSTAPVFCFFFGVLLHIETFSTPVFLSLLGIAGGLAVAVVSSVDATGAGVLLCLSAAASGGLRWTLTQMLLKADPPSSSHFMVAIYRFAPSSALAMLPLALMLELPRMAQQYAPTHSSSVLLEAGAITCAGGLISFLLIAVELRLLTLTSSLTLGVLGTLKEALQISLGMVIFGEHLSAKTAAGLGVSVLCGCLYRVFKQRREQAESYSKLAQDETGALLLELSSVFSRTDLRDLEGEEDEDEEEKEEREKS